MLVQGPGVPKIQTIPKLLNKCHIRPWPDTRRKKNEANVLNKRIHYSIKIKIYDRDYAEEKGHMLHVVKASLHLSIKNIGGPVFQASSLQQNYWTQYVLAMCQMVATEYDLTRLLNSLSHSWQSNKHLSAISITTMRTRMFSSNPIDNNYSRTREKYAGILTRIFSTKDVC